MAKQRNATQYFYSRPCGRGDCGYVRSVKWLEPISTHAPAGGATRAAIAQVRYDMAFLLTPLREGRQRTRGCEYWHEPHFYSRPCGRGDLRRHDGLHRAGMHFYSRPCGRGDR